MDANGLRFWMLSQHDDWIAPTGSDSLYYCTKNNRLQLRSVSRAKQPVEDFTIAKGKVEASPMTLDQFGNDARWDQSSGHVVAGGSGPGEVPIYAPPAMQTVSDLVMGYDGILYVAVAGALVMVDRRGRWPSYTLSDPGFTFWRLLALPEGGVLALDRTKSQLGKVTGQPLPTGPQDTPDVGILRSCNADNLPRIAVRYALQSPDVFVAFTAMDQGNFALLSWQAATAENQVANLQLFTAAGVLEKPIRLSNLKWPYAIAWAGEQKLGVLVSNSPAAPIFKEALVFDLQDATSVLAQSGDTYILKDQNVGPFVHGFGLPPSYAAGTDIFPLLPLSLNSFAQSGVTAGIGPTTQTTAVVAAGNDVAVAVADSTGFQTGQQAVIDASANQEQFKVAAIVDATRIVAEKLAKGHASGVTVDPGTPRSFDSGVSQTVWHRMFIEAIVPPRCGVVVWLAASDNRADLNSGGAATWFPHFLGTVQGFSTTMTAAVLAGNNVSPACNVSVAVSDSSGFQTGQLAALDVAPNQEQVKIVAIPDATHIVADQLSKNHPSGVVVSWMAGTSTAVWQSEPSEAPFAPAMLGQDPVAGQQGLFMVLVQRAGTVVRSLRGRYLGVRLVLSGDRRDTPEIAALRVYASRFSYVEHYLPEIYHEQKFGAEADKLGSSTHRDFFERFVDIFEAQLTRIEDRVANSYVLTRPESTPDSALDWLGSWIGLDDTGYPPGRRRARLLAAPELYRGRKTAPGGRGTVPGVTQALDVATNGLCSQGAIIVIEDFRLRRIYATILGADLSIQDDALLPGFSGSGNSIVGDTLFLGDPRDKEFLALFANAVETPSEQQQVQSFYDQLAHRITVFVHDQVETVDLKLVQMIVEQERPAHVMANLVRAKQPLMVGLASLLSVNTYLAPEPPRGTATLDVSQIGRYDVITHVPSLDPRLENGQTAGKWDQPVARISTPNLIINPGHTVSLDGTASTAPAGTVITTYTWSLSEE